MVARLEIPPAPQFARRDSDAPISPSSSETDDVFGGYAHGGQFTPRLLPRSAVVARTRTARACGSQTAPDAFDRRVEADEEADADGDGEQEVHTPGMEISFDLDSDASPRMSSDDCTSPIIQASGSHTPHTYAPAPLEAKQSAPRPSGAALPARGSTSQHLANKIRPAALSSQTLSFAHAHEQRRTRNGNADARGHASRSEGVHMADRAIVSRRESQESEEETGLLLSSPDFMLGLNGSSHYECPAGTGRVPMPISISSQSEPSDDDVPNTASTLRTARPKRYISAHTGRYALKTTRTTRPPATASPSYRLDWRHRSAHPPVSRSYSCPSLRTCKEQTGRPQARHGGGPVRHPPSNLPTPGMSAMVRNPVDETLIAGPSSTLRRALSAGSRSKRNTFGPCEIYDDAGGEYAVAAYTGAGIDGTKLKPCEAPRRHPGHPARSISDIHSCKRHLDGTESSSSSHRDSRYCPSGPSSARTSPFHGPIQLPDEVAIFPGGVRMTPTSSLDGVVGVIRASSMAISEHGMEEPKDGEEVLKDSSDAPGYAIDPEPMHDGAPPGEDLPNDAETGADRDGRVSNPKGPLDEGEKDVSDVYAHGNESPILPCDPLPPISTFAPSSTDAISPPIFPVLPQDEVAADATRSLDDCPLHSTSVNTTRPPSTSSSSSITAPATLSIAPAHREEKTPSPASRVSVDSLLLSTPLDPPNIYVAIPEIVKGGIEPSSDRKESDAGQKGQHTLESTSSRQLPRTPKTASRVSVLYPTPPPRSALPPTPASAPLDRAQTVSRSSRRLSYQLSPTSSVRRSLTQSSSSPRSDRSSPTFDTDHLLPPFPTRDRQRRPISAYIARTGGDIEHKGDEQTVNMALQVDYRTNQQIPTMSRPGHLKQPSVPYSTRSSFSTSTVPLDAPHNYFNRNSAQSTSTSRRSRYTASSSGSSIYSSDSEIGNKAYHRATERPEISTVFEEEGSFDAGPHSGTDFEQTLHRKQSNSTFDSAQYIPSARRQRAGTISSQYSGLSDRSAHPFAASASRSIERNMSGFLQPKAPSLQPSRSSPNLRAMAKEGAMTIHQVTLAESSDEDDDKCPVCIESLNASFKLPGEKPHIVPECGHALHEECFTHVYGDVPSSGSTRNVGLCGVCRQPIKIVVGGGDKKKRGKFAAMTGQGSGLKGGSSTSVNSSGRESVSSNLQANDPVVPASSGSPKRGGTDNAPRIIIPNINVRPETSTMNKQKRQLAAMITVQAPSAGERERYPRPNRSRSEASLSPALPPSPISTSSMDGMLLNNAAVGATLPLDAVQADLERRLQDFGKSSLDECGPLRLYDLLDVRKGDTKRPFLMYLFSDALACISEETPFALSKMFKSGGTLRSSKSTRSVNTAQATKTTLKLRGRIHFKHVRKVIDSSTANELSLTILMIDETHQTFILAFKDRKQYTLWKNMLDKVLKDLRDRGVSETGGNSASKVAKLMGTGAPIALRKANTAISPSSTINSQISGLGLSSLDAMSPTMSPYSTDHEYASSYATPMQPLGPIHTPVDIVLVLAIPHTASAPESAPLKIRLMRQALGFVLATLGPCDRISLVSCEQGVNVRKTPFLCATRPDSRRRLEQFVENLGAGGAQPDEFEVEFAADERADLVTAMNVSLDVLLQRTARNPLAGLVVVSDTAGVVRAGQLELIFARLDSVNIPIHTIGYGKAHDPSPLWLLCNQSNGTYTFVREWYHLRDTLAGVVGGLMSIAMTRARISLSCADNDFRIARVMGVQTPIPAQGAKTIDIELRDLRFGETREILVELDYEGDGGNTGPSRPNTSLSITSSMDRLSLADSSSVVRDMVVEGRMADDVPAVEVDCSYHDPASGRSVSRLTQPILLTTPIVSAPSAQPANSRVLAFDPVVKRRRMEILGSDMIARALLLMTRQNANQAERLLLETRGVIVRLINTITNSLPQDRPAMSRKELLAVQNAEMMQSVVDDLEMMAEAVLDQPQVFERDHRNTVTQQASILRTQRSWSTRSSTERMYCTDEVREFLQLSGEWTVRA